MRSLEAGATVAWTWDIRNNRLFADDNLARRSTCRRAEAEGGLLDECIQSIHPDDWPRVSASLDGIPSRAATIRSGLPAPGPGGPLGAAGSSARGRRADEAGRPVRCRVCWWTSHEQKRAEENSGPAEIWPRPSSRKEELLVDRYERARRSCDCWPTRSRSWRGWRGRTATSSVQPPAVRVHRHDPEQMEGWGWQSVHDPDVLPGCWSDGRGPSPAASRSTWCSRSRARTDSSARSSPGSTRCGTRKGRILYWFGTNTGHQRDQADGGGAAGGRPPQGRVPGDAGPRAAQPAGPDPQRAANPQDAAGSMRRRSSGHGT